jgi:predicted amidohydrolase YtcJ
MDDARSWASALAVRASEIVYVGDDAGVEDYIGATTEVLDLDSDMVLPGFHDSHVHPVSGGVELAQCDLNGLDTRDKVLEAIANFAAANPADEWIVGGGWDLTLFPAANPDRGELDRIVSERPVYLSSADGHSAWVNSRALELAGVIASTPDPPNGRIEREASGAPRGTLRESAMALVSRKLPPLSPSDYADGLKRALAMANRYGITSLVEASASDHALDAYQTLAREGTLTARVRLSLAVDETRDESQVDDLVRKRDRYRGERLFPDAAKIFADGVIEAHTAALLEPYLDVPHRGELNFDPSRLEPLVARLDREGFQVHIHAIGDRAIRASLDAFEKARRENGVRDSRHQIAHIELFDPLDIPRFRELGVVADFQPLWAYADAYITELTEPVLGAERSRWLYPIRTVADSGAMLAAGSDWSVSSMNPLDAIQVAVTRRAPSAGEGPAWIPEERVDLDTMLAAYTRGGAYVQHQENLVGTIEVGKRADLVVLDENLFDVPAHELHRVKVRLTFLDGEIVYRDES